MTPLLLPRLFLPTLVLFSSSGSSSPSSRATRSAPPPFRAGAATVARLRHRRLEEDFAFDLAKYSVKFVGCQGTHFYDSEEYTHVHDDHDEHEDHEEHDDHDEHEEWEEDNIEGLEEVVEEVAVDFVEAWPGKEEAGDQQQGDKEEDEDEDANGEAEEWEVEVEEETTEPNGDEEVEEWEEDYVEGSAEVVEEVAVGFLEAWPEEEEAGEQQQGEKEEDEDEDANGEEVEEEAKEPNEDEEVSGGGDIGDGSRRRKLEQDFDRQRFGRGTVTFLLCANDDDGGSTTCAESCGSSDYGAMDIDMDVYLQAMVEWKLEAQAEYCESCLDTSFPTGDVAACFADCENIDNMEENGYLDAAEFADCQRLDTVVPETGEQIYAGAVCDNSQGSSRIKIGVFLDEYCTVYDESKDVEDYLMGEDEIGPVQMRLSHALLKTTYDTSDCVANCRARDDRQELFEIPPVNQVCEELYYASSLPDIWYEESGGWDDDFSDDVEEEDGMFWEDDVVWEEHDITHDSVYLYPGDPGEDSLNYTAREYNALGIFYDLTNGRDGGWRNVDLWTSDSGVCKWYGVICDGGGSVTSLNLESNLMWQAGMPFSRIYDVSLRRLANLTELDLGGNGLWGSFPRGIGTDLPRLTHLKLGNNYLTNTIPKSLSQLSQLRVLELQGNDFSWIQMNDGYSSLEYLDLGDNQLDGTVQFDLARLNQLRSVSLRNNRLMGGFARDYSGLANLTDIDISYNRLSGVFPSESFSKNPELRYLNVSRNAMVGTISVDTMKSAFESNNGGDYVLDFSFNRLEGTMPNFEVEKLVVNVVGNRLEGIDPAACERAFWNDWAVRMFRCDGIACPNGTANSEGRQTSIDEPCESCNASSYFGTVGCYEREEHDEFFYHDDDEDADYFYDDAMDDRFFEEEPDCPLNCLNGGACVHSRQAPPSVADGNSNGIFTDSTGILTTIEYSCRCWNGYTGTLCADPPVRPSFPGSSLAASSYLQVVSPEGLAKPGGYDHQVALFGPATFRGGANVYYAGSDLCDEMMDDKLPSESSIFMVDRGQCTFTRKARNAQNMGALAVIIADNACLCDATDSCVLAPDEKCETGWPVLSDDGSASDIVIPAFLILKQDAELIKEEIAKSTNVVMELTLSQSPTKTDRVEYELWMTPADVASREFLLRFKEFAQALSGYARFTPRLSIFDGIESNCVGEDGENMCADYCTNGGRYCAIPPNNLISGTDVVRESLNWICIREWLGYGGDYRELQWWDYVANFIQECADSFDQGCSDGAMNKADIDPELIAQCVDDHGGLEGNVENKLLEEHLRLKQQQGIDVVPTLRVNKNTIIENFDSVNALEAICAGFAAGSAPPVCGSNTVLGPAPTTRPPSGYAPTPPPVSGYVSTPPPPTPSSLIRPTPPQDFVLTVPDEEKNDDGPAILPSTQPPDPAATPSDSTVPLSSTNVPESSSSDEPSFAPSRQPLSPATPSYTPSGQVTTSPSVSASLQPTTTATDPDLNLVFNSGQFGLPRWQFLLLLMTFFL